MKRYLAIACALAMLLALAVPAMGEETQPTLEEITLDVKQALDISDDYTGFTSDNYDGIWNLTWTDGDTSIYVTCTAEGEILSYSNYGTYYDYSYTDDYVPRFPTAGTDSVRAIVEDFLGRVVPEGKSWTLDDVTESLENDNTTDVYVSGRLVIGEYPTDISISVTVDLAGMTVTNYYRSDSYMDFAGNDYDAAVNVTEAEARALLKDKSALTLEYYVVNGGDMAKLCYIRDYNGTYIVRASDGTVVNVDEAYGAGGDDGIYAMSADYGETAAEAAKQLTEAELKGISVYDDALSADELDAAARAISEFGITDDYLLTTVNYYNGSDVLLCSLEYSRKISDDELKGRYGMSEDAIAAISADRGYYDTKSVTLVAATGELDSFYTSHPYIYGTYNSDVDAAEYQAVSDAFIEKYFPDIFASIELSSQYSYASTNYYSPTASYNYARMYNGYKFDGNYVNVSVNADDGTIDSFNKYWNDGQEFEERDETELVSADDAYETFVAAFPFELALISVPQSDETYGYNYIYTRTLAWHYVDSYEIYGVDAVTGEILRDSYDTSSGAYEYSDIEGVPEQAAIEALAQYGVGFPGGAFRPGDALTVRDMLSLILMGSGYTDVEEMNYEDICSSARQLGATDFSESEPDAAVTKLQFAGLIVDMYGLEAVANLEGVYACGFADDATIAAEDYGHVALAYGMGLISPGENGNIDAAAELTRAEGAQILYNFLNRAF